MHTHTRSPRRTAASVAAFATVALLTASACSASSHPAATQPGAGPPSTTRKIHAALSAEGPQLAVGALTSQLPFPGDADVTNPQPRHPGNDRNITWSIKLTDGLRLDNGWYHSTDRWSHEEPPPPSIRTGGSNYRLQVRGVAPGLVAAYQIYDAAGKATDYWIGAKFYSPAAGTNKWECFVYQDNPRTDGQPTRLSPYICVWTNYRGSNPEPVLTVGNGTVVTNKAQAKQLLTQYCNTTTAVSDCQFVNFGYGTALGESKIVGQQVTNDGDTKVKHTVGWKDTTKASNTVGIEVGVEVEFWNVWKASLTAKYEHTWESSHTFAESTEVDLEPHSIGWVDFAPNMQSSEGTWVINTGDQRYVIPSITLTAPLPDGGHILVNECPLANYHNGVCTKGLTTISVQP
jgi:hypothetical protein